MRRLVHILTITGIMMVFFSTTVLGAADIKIGVVDFQRILETSKAGKAAQVEISARGKKMEEDLRLKNEEIRELEKQLQRESMVMSPEMREETQRNVRIKINDLKVLQKRYLDDFKRLEARIINRIQEDVFTLVEKIGDAEGYRLLIEKRAGGVVYAPGNIDITDQVMKAYDAQSP